MCGDIVGLGGTTFRCRMPATFDQNIVINNLLSCTIQSISNTGTDYVGVFNLIHHKEHFMI